MNKGGDHVSPPFFWYTVMTIPCLDGILCRHVAFGWGQMAPILQLHGITKVFPGVIANDHIDLMLNEGEILALLGENGAGKTTLMNILYGLYAPDEGRSSFVAKRRNIAGPSDAIAQGIGMVHQHFMLVDPLTVTENVMLGNEPIHQWLGSSTAEKHRQRIREISDSYGLDVDPTALVRTLPVGVQQRVEIIKVLYRNADILILDEPTAVLTPQEVEDLFEIIRTLVDRRQVDDLYHPQAQRGAGPGRPRSSCCAGKSCGRDHPRRDPTRHELAAMMVGRELYHSTVDKEPAQPKAPVLDVSRI